MEAGHLALLNYGERPVVWHARLLLGHVQGTSWVILTLDHDSYEEDLSIHNPDLVVLVQFLLRESLRLKSMVLGLWILLNSAIIYVKVGLQQKGLDKLAGQLASWQEPRQLLQQQLQLLRHLQQG